MSTRINSTRRIRMISNPENDAVVQQTPISLDEDEELREINDLRANLKAKEEAYKKNKITKCIDEVNNEINNKIKKLPRTDESIVLLENISRMIPDEPIVHEPIVNEPIELLVNDHVANTSKIRLENLPDRIVLVAKYRNQTNKIIYNKSDEKFYRYDKTNKTCYKTLNEAYTKLFNNTGNAWERFKAYEIEGNGKSPIDTIDKIKLVVENSEKYCDKNFPFTL